MNRTFSRFAAAMIASTSLAGVSYGVANAATMGIGPDAVALTPTVAAIPVVSADVLGSAGVEVVTTGALTPSFRSDFLLTNVVAANSTRLYRASLNQGTWGPAARNFAAPQVLDVSVGNMIVPATTLAVVSGGTDASNSVLLEMSTIGTATEAGDAFTFDFTVNSLQNAAAGSSVVITGDMAFAADPGFATILETATATAFTVGAGVSTTLTAGAAATISGISNFTQFTTAPGISTNTSAAIGNLALNSGQAGGQVGATGLAYTAVLPLDGAGGGYVIAVTTNVPTNTITTLCFETAAAIDGDCLDATDFAANAINTTTGVYTWTIGGTTGAGVGGWQDNAGGNQLSAVTTGTQTLSAGTFDIAVTATTDTAGLAAFNRASGGGQALVAFGTWVLGGLNAWLGPVLVGNPSFLSVVRGTNSSAFTGNFMATVRDQATGTTIGNANTVIQAAVPVNGAWQMTADAIVTAVGGALTGINSLTMQITCGCTGSAATLMLGGGVFSNVTPTAGDGTAGSGR